MGTVYTFTTYIEKAGTITDTKNIIGGNTSLSGHIWWRSEKYVDGNLRDFIQAGYTSKGIVTNDANEYAGDPAYTSRTVQIAESGFTILKEFGTPGSALANQLGFGLNSYGLFANSCVDYNYKAMELAGLNPIKFEGVPIPINNKAYLDSMLPKAIDPVAASLSSTPPIADSVSTLTPPNDATTRDSANFITDISANDHQVIINSGGNVWDAYVVQKNSPNGFKDWNEFKTAVAASNPEITDLNKIQSGQTIYLPEKFADGSITYHMTDGASINNNAATGECQMALPGTEGGTVFFQRTVDATTGDTRSRYVESDAVTGAVTCTAVIDEHSDGSRIESLSYPNGVQLRRAFDANGALIAQDVAGSRWQTDPAAIESLAAGDSALAFAAFTAALRLKTEDSLVLVRSAFGRAASASSPLILDLDGDPSEITGDQFYIGGTVSTAEEVAYLNGVSIDELQAANAHSLKRTPMERIAA